MLRIEVYAADLMRYNVEAVLLALDLWPELEPTEVHRWFPAWADLRHLVDRIEAMMAAPILAIDAPEIIGREATPEGQDEARVSYVVHAHRQWTPYSAEQQAALERWCDWLDGHLAGLPVLDGWPAHYGGLLVGKTVTAPGGPILVRMRETLARWRSDRRGAVEARLKADTATSRRSGDAS